MFRICLPALLILTACGTGLMEPDPPAGDMDLPGMWENAPSLPDARHSFGIVEYRGDLYIVGGAEEATLNGVASGSGRVTDRVYRYNASTGWVELNPLPEGGYMNAAVVVVGDSLYLAGGFWTTGFDPGTYSDSLWVYQPDTDTWASRAPLPAPRHQPAAAAVDGKLVLVGGEDQAGGLLAGGIAYDPATNAWSTIPAPRRPRTHATAVVHAGQLYLVSGNHESRTTDGYPEIERYDPATNQWSDVTLLPLTVAGAAVTIKDGMIHVIGGRGLDNRLKDAHHVYDITADEWTEYRDLPGTDGRYFHRAFVLNGMIHVGGGRTAGTTSTSAVHRFVPDP